MKPPSVPTSPGTTSRPAHGAGTSLTRIRVVHLVSTLNIGGLEKVVYDLARRTDAAVFDIHVLCLGEIGMLAADFARAGIRVDALGVLGRGTLRSVLAVTARLQTLRPAVLHTHNPAPHIVGAAAAVLAGVPAVVHTKHGRNYPEDRSKVLANRVAGLLTDYLIAVSQDAGRVATGVERVPARKVRLIRNGIDLRAFSAAGCDSPAHGSRAVHVGRLILPTKDQITLLRAARLVADADPEFRLDIVGDGPHRGVLEALTDKLNLGRLVEFHGFRHDVTDFLRRAALFVLSSETEGLSVTLLEAMAAGLPVVATDVGGNREAVADGQTGLLVPPRSPEALAAGMLNLLRDPGRRRAMGCAGRRRVEREFSLDAMIAQYEETYRLALCRRARTLAQQPADVGGRGAIKAVDEAPRAAGKAGPVAPARMRIAHMTLSAAPGGRREAILSLAARLKKEGVGAHLLCLEGLGSPTDKLLSAFDTVHAMDQWSMYRPSAIRALGRLCKSLDIDLIHAHDAASQFAAALLRATGHRIRVVTTFHRTLGFESARIRDRLRNALAGLVTDAVVVGSRERREHYLARNWIASRKVIQIPFGVDLARFRPDAQARAAIRGSLGIPDETILIGAAGHFGPVKGLDVAVRAFEALLRRRPTRSVRLLIVGTGTPDREAHLRSLADRTPPGNVLFAGFQEAAERYLAAMDVFLHTPRAEAFGLVVAEAMATGLPVVGASVGGVLDMVRPGETGVLVAPENPDAIADALALLVAGEDDRGRLGRQARNVAAKEYSLDLYADRHRRLYNEVLGGLALDPH